MPTTPPPSLQSSQESPPLPPLYKPGSFRNRLLKLAVETLAMIEGEPPESLLLDLSGMLKERATKLRIEAGPGEPEFVLGWGARLDRDDLAVLRILADADEPMLSRDIAKAMKIDHTDFSELRRQLGPKAKLRAEHFISHTENAGYGITEKGRNALQSDSDEH